MIPNIDFWELLFHSGDIIHQTPRAMGNEGAHYSIIYNKNHCIKVNVRQSVNSFVNYGASTPKGIMGPLK